MAASQALLCTNRTFLPTKPIIHCSKAPQTHISHFRIKSLLPSKSTKATKWKTFKLSETEITCRATPRKPTAGADEDLDSNLRKVLQALLCVAEGIYIFWLFLLPFAPVSISLCFFFFFFPLIFYFWSHFFYYYIHSNLIYLASFLFS